jgi:transcriptional regulator with XRE-family HTH domain
MLEQMPFDNLDEFAAPDYHPIAPDGQTAVVTIGQLAEQLKGYREAAERTQSQIATALDWSASKVARVEAGTVRPSVADVKAMLAVCRVTEEDKIEAASAMARANRKPRDTTYKNVISPDHWHYLEYEAAAKELSVYSAILVPDFLCTEAYAQSVRRTFSTSDQDEAHIALQSRLRRERAAYLLGPNGPALRIILDQMVFYHPISNEQSPADRRYDEVAAIIRGLQRLNTAGRTKAPAADSHLNPKVSVQIVPAHANLLPGEGSPFSIVSVHGKPVAANLGIFDREVNWHGPGASDKIQSHQAVFDTLSSRIPSREHTNHNLDIILTAMAGGARSVPDLPV